MGADAGEKTPPEGNGPATTELRALLGAVVQATDYLVAALDAAGLTQQLRDSPIYYLRHLDRSLPAYTVTDLLLVCEAYATVTAPTALATGDLAQVRDEAQRTLHLVQAVAGAGRGRRRLTLSETITKGAHTTLLRNAFSKPPVQAALARLIDALAALASIDGVEARKRRRLLPLGSGCVVPITVLGGAITLIVFLLASIAVASGQVSVTPDGVRIPAISGPHGVLASASPSTSQRSPTPRPAPTAISVPMPAATPTVTTPPSTPMLDVSKNSVFPCPGAPDSFTITYTGGQQPITWGANWPDHVDITLSPNSGTLQPGGIVTVIVDAPQTSSNVSGWIAIAASGGLSAPSVQYNSNNC
ncbi:MAG: hypothetical protein PVSMB4_14690 [Ktedonobacterales bacterium]